MHRNRHYFWGQYVYPRLRRKPECCTDWYCYSGTYGLISRPLDMAAGQEKKRNQTMRTIKRKESPSAEAERLSIWYATNQNTPD